MENGRTYPVAMRGAPNAKHRQLALPGLPDRVSTSESVDAYFLPAGGIESIIQQGNVVYTDSQPPEKRMQAWASLYTPSDRILPFTGSPRVEAVP